VQKNISVIITSAAQAAPAPPGAPTFGVMVFASSSIRQSLRYYVLKSQNLLASPGCIFSKN
jgi:hypothetical protein